MESGFITHPENVGQSPWDVVNSRQISPPSPAGNPMIQLFKPPSLSAWPRFLLPTPHPIRQQILLGLLSAYTLHRYHSCSHRILALPDSCKGLLTGLPASSAFLSSLTHREAGGLFPNAGQVKPSSAQSRPVAPCQHPFQNSQVSMGSSLHINL